MKCLQLDLEEFYIAKFENLYQPILINEISLNLKHDNITKTSKGKYEIKINKIPLISENKTKLKEKIDAEVKENNFKNMVIASIYDQETIIINNGNLSKEWTFAEIKEKIVNLEPIYKWEFYEEYKKKVEKQEKFFELNKGLNSLQQVNNEDNILEEKKWNQFATAFDEWLSKNFYEEKINYLKNSKLKKNNLIEEEENIRQ